MAEGLVNPLDSYATNQIKLFRASESKDVVACVILKVEGTNVKGPGRLASVCEQWSFNSEGVKLCSSHSSFDCKRPQVWRRPGINLYMDDNYFLQYSCQLASLGCSCIDIYWNHQLRSYKCFKHLNSSNNWAFHHNLVIKYPNSHFSPHWSLKIESPRRFCHSANNWVNINAYCIQYESRSVRLPVRGCVFLFCVKLNKRPVSHLAGY